MHTLHMVTLIPAAREPVALLSSFTVREQADVGIVSVVVHSMGFALMAEEASIRRESGVLAVRLG